MLANGAAFAGGVGALAIVLTSLCGEHADGGRIVGAAIACALYLALAPWALRRRRALWAWPLLVVAAVATMLAVVAFVPGAHGACSFG